MVLSLNNILDTLFLWAANLLSAVVSEIIAHNNEHMYYVHNIFY